MFQEVYTTLCWQFPNEYIYHLSPTDADAGNNIKFRFIVYLYEWILDSLGRFFDSRKQIFIIHLLTKALIKVYSQPNSLESYFAKMGCGMSNTGEYYHFIYTQKFSSADYLFVFGSGCNNVVSLIHTTTYSKDTPEAYMPDGYVIDTIVYDILEAMELKNGKIFDDSDSRFGEEHEIDDENYAMSNDLEQNTRDNIYIY